MQELLNELKKLRQAIDDAVAQLKLPQLEADLAKLQQQSGAADFWQDQAAAQEVVKQQAALETRIGPWRVLQKQLAEAVELAEIGDNSVEDDLRGQLADAQKQLDELKQQLQFSGPYDDHNALLSIHAGAGGTDAQDWAQMLLRMYVRWAEQHNFKVETLEQSAGEEAGLKSATIEISGPFVYGQLRGEHGVHRLVRLSPFNADHLRQTSFAKVEVMPKIDRPDELAIDEKDLKIDVYRSGGHGGQSVNTTDSAVRVTHLPTGLSVAIQNERSQQQNKAMALTVLRSRLAQLQQEQHADQLSTLKGPNQSAEWGNQIRSYVLHPYKQVKDLRTRHESSDPDAVLAGALDPFITAYLESQLGTEK